MDETPILGFPFPEDADPPNGPAQIQLLAEALEAVQWLTANIADKAVTEAKLADALKLLVVTQPVRSTVEQLKVVRGIIDTTGAGSIVEGSGFTIKRNGTGDIEVLFTANFSDVPSVTVAAVGGSMRFVRVNEATAAAARLIVQTTGLIAADNVLSFIAIGPR